MANVDNPSGCAPWNGNGVPPRLRLYKGGTTTSIGQGDLVALATNGRVHRIATTTGSANTVGVAAHYVAAPASGVTTPPDVWVYDDPNQVFVIQDDGAAGTPAQASVGQTAPVVLGTPNTTTGRSIQELDISGLGVTNAHPFLVIGFLEGPSFEIGKNAKILVRLNRHLYRTGSVGI